MERSCGGAEPPLFLKAFRKEKKLTQAAMAERIGITQRSYAYFEGNPARATVERVFLVLRVLDVEISLAPTPTASVTSGKSQATAQISPVIAPGGKKENW
jgi:HTH-type transcriptional regulator/antitoxin HipB